MKYEILNSSCSHMGQLLMCKNTQSLVEEIIALPSNPNWLNENLELVAIYYLNSSDDDIRRAAVLMLEYKLMRFKEMSKFLVDLIKFMHEHDESEDVKVAADDLIDLFEVHL
jgi:hypothetical protein